MSNDDAAWIANYIWGIAYDVLRDLYVRGKYRVPAPRGIAVRPGRLVPARQPEDRLRDQLHEVLLQAAADADADRDPRRHADA